MTVDEIKAKLNQSARKLGLRDCKVQGVSAIKGLVSEEQKQRERRERDSDCASVCVNNLPIWDL